MATRREVLAGLAATAVVGCKAEEADWCGEEGRATDDGPFPYPQDCAVTADDIEGPYYSEGAPERAELDLYGDEGTPLTLTGQVFDDGACEVGLAGAVVEFWHADPDGAYDNRSEEMRYRGQITTDAEGRYALKTLLPGRYLNGSVLRPRHIHVKVWVEGVERLTTQLYFEGDPYIDCDDFANTSLVVPVTGDEDSSMDGQDVHFVLA